MLFQKLQENEFVFRQHGRRWNQLERTVPSSVPPVPPGTVLLQLQLDRIVPRRQHAVAAVRAGGHAIGVFGSVAGAEELTQNNSAIFELTWPRNVRSEA